MGVRTRPALVRAETRNPDPVHAVQEIAARLPAEGLAGVVFFCADTYEPEALARAWRTNFSCPVIGCTSAGEIGSSYQTRGIVAVGFDDDAFSVQAVELPHLADFRADDARSVVEALGARGSTPSRDRSVAFVLLDGLSLSEERVVALLHAALDGPQLIGGSAGDSLHFQQTRVYVDGSFASDRGALFMIESRLPFEVFQLQHFEPSEREVVITTADPSIRRVYEIDGGPAADEYAAQLGLSFVDLGPEVYSRNPLLLQIGEDWYVRSIQRANPDRSLDFYCAIEEGLPLCIGRGVGFLESLQTKVAALQDRFEVIEGTLGCDCILRRLEMRSAGQIHEVESVLEPLAFVGLSTFGEQIDAVHVNQTLTAVTFGRE